MLLTKLSKKLVAKDEFEFVLAFAVDVFLDAIVILIEAGTAGDHMAHDEVGFEVEQVVGLSFAGRIGEDAGRLLEGGGRDERIGAERCFGDPEEDRSRLRGLAAFVDHFAVLVRGSPSCRHLRRRGRSCRLDR